MCVNLCNLFPFEVLLSVKICSKNFRTYIQRGACCGMAGIGFTQFHMKFISYFKSCVMFIVLLYCTDDAPTHDDLI